MDKQKQRELIKDIEAQIKSLQKRKEQLEKEVNSLHSNPKVDDFLRRYTGEQLLKEHSLDEYGIWEVKGEDPNPDFAGHHHEPSLGLFEGRLEDVIIKAVSLDGFWSWGAGGRIIKHKEPPITKV